ncbi:hypothetical protein MPTK2_3g18800 [Marchantia polymorpha subsp. ruderalis]
MSRVRSRINYRVQHRSRKQLLFLFPLMFPYVYLYIFILCIQTCVYRLVCFLTMTYGVVIFPYFFLWSNVDPSDLPIRRIICQFSPFYKYCA